MTLWKTTRYEDFLVSSLTSRVDDPPVPQTLLYPPFGEERILSPGLVIHLLRDWGVWFPLCIALIE